MDADNALWPVSVGTAGDRNVRVFGVWIGCRFLMSAAWLRLSENLACKTTCSHFIWTSGFLILQLITTLNSLILYSSIVITNISLSDVL